MSSPRPDAEGDDVTIPVDVALRRAAELCREGRLADAERLYRIIVAAWPDHVEGLQRLGMLQYQLGRKEDALASLSAALAHVPDSAELHSNLGLVLQTLGRHEEALASYDHALTLRPDHVKALSNRGMSLQVLGRPEEALESYERALAFQPDFAEAFNHRGLVLHLLGRTREALSSYDAALAQRPDYPEALGNRGAALAALGRLEEALACQDRALVLRPGCPEAHYNRGYALARLHRHEEALAAFEAALALSPEKTEAWRGRSVALVELGRTEEALESCDRSLAVRPDQVDALIVRGTLLHRLNRHREALGCYDRALALQPDCDEARWNASLAHLVLGDLARGFEGFEARWRVKAFGTPKPAMRKRVWRAAEPLEGRTLLLHAEQGFGDALQILRYVPLLAARGARVLLRVGPELKPLVAGLEGVHRVFVPGDRVARYDLHCPMLSVPLAFGTRTVEDIPAPVPYLTAPADRAEAWRRRLGAPTRLRVGLAWSGHPEHPSDRQRSILLERLRPLLQRADLELVSLQREVRDADRAELEASGIRHFGEELGDFADTAALIGLLDLVVAVDTAVVHLAGALARPVWVLLPFSPDWRWLLAREDSPWYPTARLFRQRRSGDWDEPIARIGAALDARVAAWTPAECES